jgi:hypothetical protein
VWWTAAGCCRWDAPRTARGHCRGTTRGAGRPEPRLPSPDLHSDPDQGRWAGWERRNGRCCRRWRRRGQRPIPPGYCWACCPAAPGEWRLVMDGCPTTRHRRNSGAGSRCASPQARRYRPGPKSGGRADHQPAAAPGRCRAGCSAEAGKPPGQDGRDCRSPGAGRSWTSRAESSRCRPDARDHRSQWVALSPDLRRTWACCCPRRRRWAMHRSSSERLPHPVSVLTRPPVGSPSPDSRLTSTLSSRRLFAVKIRSDS